jgi:small nuclear ribonucleoprotein
LEPSKKPLNLLNKKINDNVLVRLKNNAEYRGKMVDCDSHMNLILEGSKEYRNNSPTTVLGKIVLRGNNILYICVDPKEE